MVKTKTARLQAPLTHTTTGLSGAWQGEVEAISKQMSDCRGKEMGSSLSPKALSLIPHWLSNI